MSLWLAVPLFVVGIGLVIFFAEKLVEGVVGTALGFGMSAFIVTVVFVGFDPENLAVGAAGSYEGVAGIALGSVLGALMVAVALAFGVTALLYPLRFKQAPLAVLIAPVLAVGLTMGLAMDNTLSRVDGGILLAAFALAVVYLAVLSRRGLDIEPGGEVAEALEEEEEGEEPNRWKSFGLMIVSLIAIAGGSELAVHASKPIMSTLELSDTVFGMTILALLVSMEELARELPAAAKGRSDITFGNVAGSVLAFFLFNAGIIALIRPVSVEPMVQRFYFPMCLLTVLLISAFMLTRRIPRWAGALLLVLYVVFVGYGFVF